mmetsp:Transcript_589/g.1242  ORF Transcript_589/g.1242 Transcript_589/m.1242 type:complete len:206 (+) Transcript_589:814-1431(+)
MVLRSMQVSRGCHEKDRSVHPPAHTHRALEAIQVRRFRPEVQNRSDGAIPIARLEFVECEKERRGRLSALRPLRRIAPQGQRWIRTLHRPRQESIRRGVVPLQRFHVSADKSRDGALGERRVGVLPVLQSGGEGAFGERGGGGEEDRDTEAEHFEAGALAAFAEGQGGGMEICEGRQFRFRGGRGYSRPREDYRMMFFIRNKDGN